MTAPRGISTWLLHGLHLLLSLSVPLILLMVVGCMKAKAKPEELGSEVPAQTIQNILNKQMDAGNLNSLAIGQYVNYSITRRIENQDTDINLGSRRIAVLDRKDTATHAIFTMMVSRSIRQDDNTFLNTVTEDELPLLKAPATGAALAKPLTTSLGVQGLLAKLPPASGTDNAPPPIPGGQRTTFHHLNEFNTTMDVPSSVRARANCEGLSPCMMNVHFVQFDMVLWNNATSYQKFSMDFGFSQQSPYLPFGLDFNQFAGMLFVDCRSTFVPIPGSSTTVYVRDCSTIDDFSK